MFEDQVGAETTPLGTIVLFLYHFESVNIHYYTKSLRSGNIVSWTLSHDENALVTAMAHRTPMIPPKIPYDVTQEIFALMVLCALLCSAKKYTPVILVRVDEM